MEEIGSRRAQCRLSRTAWASEPHLAAGAREDPLLPFCASRLAAGGVWKTYETRGGSRAKKKLIIKPFTVSITVLLSIIEDVGDLGTLRFVEECQFRTLSFKDCKQYLVPGLL